MELSNCTDCAYHRVLPDPDPLDWFCSDDVKVVCSKTENPELITCACRPHKMRDECGIPKWCPLKAEEDQ